MSVKNLEGLVFGKLKVISREPNDAFGTAMWMCLCECGEKRIVAGTGLRAGRNKSCGCLSPRFKSEELTTHGKARSRIYLIWRGMLYRCSDKENGKARKNYFDKGIRVEDRWHVFENFLTDMGEPKQHETLDRIDSNGMYCKENCRWADSKTQANNTSRNLLITLGGVTHTASEWSDITGIKANTIVYRVRRGWSAEDALNKNHIHAGVKEKNSRATSCAVCGDLFIPRITQLREGCGKCCSRKCAFKLRITDRDGKFLPKRLAK